VVAYFFYLVLLVNKSVISGLNLFYPKSYNAILPEDDDHYSSSVADYFASRFQSWVAFPANDAGPISSKSTLWKEITINGGIAGRFGQETR
jgi:hypothetical protein